MSDVARCCTALEVLEVHLDLDPAQSWAEASLARRAWYLLDDKTCRLKRMQKQLQRFLVTSGDSIFLHIDESKGIPDPNNSLACITAGSLANLQGLSLCSDEPGRTSYTANYMAERDAAMLKSMSALEWLEIGREPLLVPFHRTVRGQLTRGTATNFQQATEVHCTGLADDGYSVQSLPPMPSIKSWVSLPAKWRETTMMQKLAPNLETLHIVVVGPSVPSDDLPVEAIQLGPAKNSVDVLLDVHGGGMCIVKGCPQNLEYLRIDACVIRLELKLLEWMQAMQAQPLMQAEQKTSIDGAHVNCQQASGERLVLLFDPIQK